MILPTTEAERWFDVSNGKLRLLRRTDVRTTPHRAPKRILLEFTHPNAQAAPERPICDELVIGTGEHERYTDEYRILTGDFYLKF